MDGLRGAHQGFEERDNFRSAGVRAGASVVQRRAISRILHIKLGTRCKKSLDRVNVRA